MKIYIHPTALQSDSDILLLNLLKPKYPSLKWNVNLKREYVGDFPTEMLEHFYYTLAMNAKATLHVVADGKNKHHGIESVFKGFAKALRFAVSRNERTQEILPLTKGTI